MFTMPAFRLGGMPTQVMGEEITGNAQRVVSSTVWRG
jgi:hypothetical protein